MEISKHPVWTGEIITARTGESAFIRIYITVVLRHTGKVFFKRQVWTDSCNTELYLIQVDVPWKEKHVEFLSLCFWVWLSEEQQDLASNWSHVVAVQQPLKKTLHYAKGGEVGDCDDHMSVCNQRLEEVHSIVSDVDDRQQTFRRRSCENTELWAFALYSC